MGLYDRDYMRSDEPSLLERLRNLSAFHWFFWANIVVFVVQYVLGIGGVESGGRFIPDGRVSMETLTKGQVWTPFTYMFVHGNVAHLLLNLFGLWFAGKRVQEIYGERRFAIIYILSGLVGAAMQLVASMIVGQDAWLVGASAAAMGLLLAYALAMPEEEVSFLFMFVIPVRFRLWSLAKFLIIFNLVLAAVHLMKLVPLGAGGQVAYMAHVGGALAGWYYARLLGYGGGLPSMESFTPEPKTKSTRKPAMAGTRRSRPVVELDEEAIRRQAATRNPVADLMRDEVDPILDKINDHGMSSLTDDELRILQRASRKLPGNGNGSK